MSSATIPPQPWPERVSVEDYLETEFLMYQRIPSLEEYAVVSQRPEFPEVSVFRKSEGWEPGHLHTSGEVTFQSVGLTVRVEELYGE